MCRSKSIPHQAERIVAGIFGPLRVFPGSHLVTGVKLGGAQEPRCLDSRARERLGSVIKTGRGTEGCPAAEQRFEPQCGPIRRPYPRASRCDAWADGGVDLGCGWTPPSPEAAGVVAPFSNPGSSHGYWALADQCRQMNYSTPCIDASESHPSHPECRNWW